MSKDLQRLGTTTTGDYRVEVVEDVEDGRFATFVTYLGAWGSGETVWLEHPVEDYLDRHAGEDDDDDAIRALARKWLKSGFGDFDVRDWLAREGYDEFTNPRRRPR